MDIVSANSLRERLRKTHPRTRRIQQNTLIGLLAKGGGIIISLLLVPLTIDYLRADVYGTWLTISSVVMMLSLLDIGIGNGLRNKLSEAITKQDETLAKVYVSSAYFMFGCIQLLFAIIFLAVHSYIPWQQLLNTSIDSSQLQLTVLIVTVSVAIKMIFDILLYVLFAVQQSGLASVINFLSNLLVLVITYLLVRFSESNLVYLATATAVSPIVILLIASIVLYSNRLSPYIPILRQVSLTHAKALLSLGYQFFLIQIAVIVLFYTDNLIIAQLFGASEVTVYNVSYRYFNSATTLFSIIITPFWSAFTEAYTKNDSPWMKRTYGNLQKLWVLFFVLVLGMVVIAEPVYSLWLGNRVTVPFLLNCAMAASSILICWNNTTVSVLNGLGKIRIQLFCSIFAAIVNIPLAIYLSREMGLGSSGVILSTCLSLLPAAFTGAVQAKKLINNDAQGIWNQ